MPMKIKYLKRPLPNDREAPAKWYATPIIDKPETITAMTRAATENTSTAPLEMQAALGLFGNYARKRLLAGGNLPVLLPQATGQLFAQLRRLIRR